VKGTTIALCHSCLFKDNRPELGGGRNLVYCTKKDKVISPKSGCEIYVRATEKSKEELKASIYGTYEEDEES
jgi:hypothetical protein